MNKNKRERKVPKFTVTPHIDFFDVYFKTFNRVRYELEQWYNNSCLLPTNRTDGCDCHSCTTQKFTNRDSVEEHEVYLSQDQQEEGYSAVARFKKMHSTIIEDFLCCQFEYDEFFIKRVKYVFDFESKKPDDLLDLITESIEISLNRTVYENIHAYVETCIVTKSKEPVIRLNIVVNYPINKIGIGEFKDTASDASMMLAHIKFCVFDQDIFLSALTNQCMQITDSQVESLKKQLQDTSNINDLRKITSRYVDSNCFKVHPFHSLFGRVASQKEFKIDPPSYKTKKVVFNSDSDIIPELEYYLPEYK